MDKREEIIAYIHSLKAGKARSVEEIKDGFDAFMDQQAQHELSGLADRHGLESEALQAFVDGVLDRLIFDGEQLSDLFAPLELGWKARSKAELALMEELAPFLKKQAGGREISGLKAYE
jgi:type I restriction enzyme R subunit